MPWSTAVSDGALTAVCLGASATLLRVGGRSRTLGGMGFGLVGFAAALGTLRFGFFPSIEPAHTAFSRVAGLVGVPLIGVGFATSALSSDALRKTVGISCLVALPLGAMALGWLPLYRLGVGGLAMVVSIAISARHLSSDRRVGFAGISGAGLVMLAGLVIGTDGELMGFQRIDWFHYVLATANALLALSLLRQGQEPGQ